MRKRWFLFLTLAAVAVGLGVVWLFVSCKVACLTLDKRLAIEVNGTPVKGEVLGNRFTAVVTRRDAGKKHSYQLFFEGDTDFTGDMGQVVDCHEWVAPHLPFLFETRDYPPCKRRQEDGPTYKRWLLISRGKSMQFVTKDHSTLSVVTHN